jgi:hypothetical protein
MKRYYSNPIIFIFIILILSSCSPKSIPAITVTFTLTATETPIPSSILTPTVTLEPTIAATPTTGIAWPNSTDDGNKIIFKILSQFSDAGIKVEDVIYYTEDNDLNKLLGRPHQYIAKASWRDPNISTSGEVGVNTGGSIEVFLNERDLKARYDYIDAITSSSPLFVEYHYSNPPAFLRLSKDYTPSKAKSISEIFMQLKF